MRRICQLFILPTRSRAVGTSPPQRGGGTLNYTNSVTPPLTHQFSSSVTAQTSNLTLDTVRVGINHTFN
jgi:hypothetical protein